MSAEVDKLRSQLYLDLGAFVDTYRAATDKDAPRWRDEALTRVSQVYRYATLEGRRRFLDEMKLPGADKERRLAFEVCQRGGSDEATCRAKAEALPLFRPIFEAFPRINTLAEWYGAPVTQLVGTFDPANPPAEELKDWRDTLREESPTTSTLLGGAEAASDAVGGIVDDVGEALDVEPEPEPGISWWKVGGVLAGTAIVGAIVYRIATPK
ncbi:MAG: hypothetical protein H6711_35170 [Myxococcales bacterium]|nr:hypothetical protein [Myxococcales bacterium]